MAQNVDRPPALTMPTPSGKVHVAEKIYKELRHDIAFGRLMPRQRLVESELCERFSTTNHNVRQAFELLDRVGLVERKPNRGVEVKALSSQELHDLRDIRVMLQREGARLLDLAQRDQILAELTAANTAYDLALESDQLNAAAEANDAFHMTLFKYCRNAELAALQLRYWLKASAIISRALAEKPLAIESRRDHVKIIEAVRDQDLERLAVLSVEHIGPAVSAYQRRYGLS